MPGLREREEYTRFHPHSADSGAARHLIPLAFPKEHTKRQLLPEVQMQHAHITIFPTNFTSCSHVKEGYLCSIVQQHIAGQPSRLLAPTKLRENYNTFLAIQGWCRCCQDSPWQILEADRVAYNTKESRKTTSKSSGTLHGRRPSHTPKRYSSNPGQQHINAGWSKIDR